MHLSTTLMRLSRSATLLASALIQHFSLIWVAVRRWGLAGCAAGAAATGAADAFGARLVVAESPAQPARRASTPSAQRPAAGESIIRMRVFGASRGRSTGRHRAEPDERPLVDVSS